MIDLNGLASKALNTHGEPQPIWMWEVEIFQEEPQKLGFMDALNPFASKNAEEVMKFHAKKLTIPEDTREPIESNFMGKSYAYTGKSPGMTEVSLTVFDDTRLTIYRYFKEWINLTGDPAYGRSEKMGEVFKRIKCTLKDPTDIFITGHIDFKKCFPKTIGSIELDYETSDFFSFDVTFVANYVFVNENFYGM